jgi:flagellar biosynthesis/type III secretory pathway M-ring protein FliF/YscJ
MPPQLQALLQNRNALIGLIAGAVLLLAVVLVFALQPKVEPVGGGLLTKEDRKLFIVETEGKALEIQALLAREGIRVVKQEEGAGAGKYPLAMSEEATKEDKDRAIITLVQSGLMDRNIGLEAFDKGDLTASREEKRVKLVRAQQGELARLIRKIDPIQDASVSLSIPEPTLFKGDQKPMSASVQVTLDGGERIGRDKVRSIINLVVGAIQGLDANHVALSDTNGNTYNSVLDIGSEMMDKLEDQDAYMKQKVASQLDKLMGTGHYVVTVSTLLRDVTRETLTQNYDPASTVVQTKQSFNESMNGSGGGAGGAGQGTGAGSGPASTVVPNGLTRWMGSGPPFAYPPPQQGYPEPPKTIQVPKQLVPYVKNRAVPLNQPGTQHPYHNHAQTTANVTPNGQTQSVTTANSGAGGKGYERSGSEVAYATGRSQTLETALPGVLEDISVAVSVDKAHMPNMPIDALKVLVAKAASPKVLPENVSVVITDFSQTDNKMDANSDTAHAGHSATGGAGAAGNHASGANANTDLPPGFTPPDWTPWLVWGGISVLLVGVLVAVLLLSQANRGDKQQLEQTQKDLDALKALAMDQQDQIKAAQAQASMAMQTQNTQNQAQTDRQATMASMKDTLQELQQVFNQQEPAQLSQQLQQWMNNG